MVTKVVLCFSPNTAGFQAVKLPVLPFYDTTVGTPVDSSIRQACGAGQFFLAFP